MSTDATLSLRERYPDVFRRSPLKRFGAPLMLAGAVLYCIYAAWFFNLGAVISEAHWERVGIYLSQWISYDVQVAFRLDKPVIEPQYPNNSQLGSHPHPEGYVAFLDNDAGGVEIEFMQVYTPDELKQYQDKKGI